MTASVAFAEAPDYNGDQVVRVVPQDLRQLRIALAVAGDVWSHGAAIGSDLDLRVDARALAALQRAGLAPKILIADLGGAIASEKARLAASADAGDGGVAGGDAWFEDFKTFAQIDAKLTEFATQRPDIASTFVVGTTLEGRTVRGVRVSSAAPGAPAILFNGCQHAREWVSPMTVMYIANRLVDTASSDPAVANLLSKFEIFLIPVVNADGYQFSWDDNRLWRKNRRNNGDGTMGVDLNRNWDFQWGGVGSSGDTNSETYRGPFPFSEPESQMLRDFYYAHSNILASIDFHSYSQLVLSPWGWTTAPAPDAALFQSMGTGMRNAILGVFGTNYIAGPIGTTLYLAAGNVVDWAYGAQDSLAYTIELRDTGTFGFILPPDQIIPTGVENFAAISSFLTDLSAPAAISLPSGAPTQLLANSPMAVSVRLRELRGELLPNGGKLFTRDLPSQPFSSSPLIADGTNQWIAMLPATPCGRTLEWYVEAATNIGTVTLPLNAPNAVFTALSIVTTTLFHDSFESNLGWSVGGPADNATSGQWVRADPIGTTAQPENDSSLNGTVCFITGQGPLGGGPGAADVDGGQTTLTSPILDCSSPGSYISYDRWYSNDLGGSPNQDSMPIEISNNGGSSWTQLELVTENANAWVTKTFLVSDFVTPSASVRIRFIARDLGAGTPTPARTLNRS